MAYDMGKSTGEVDLDTSPALDSLIKLQQAFQNLDSNSQKSLTDIQAFAANLMDVLNSSYQGVVQSSTAMKAAQEAYNNVLKANENILAGYEKAVTEAEQKHVQAQAVTVQKQQEYNAAMQQTTAQLERYNELRSKEGTNLRSIESNHRKYLEDLAVEKAAKQALVEAQNAEKKALDEVNTAYKKYESVAKSANNEALNAQKSIEKENTKVAESVLKNSIALEKEQIKARTNIEEANIASIERATTAEVKAEQKAIADIEKAKIKAQSDIEKANILAAERSVEKEVEAEKNASAKIEKAKIDAQAKIEKAKVDADKRAATQELAIRQKAQTDVEKAMIASETKLQQTKIREAEKGTRQAAQIEAREREQATRQAQREQEQAARDISDKQVMAFAVAAKAVDEVVNGVKRLAQEMINLSKQVVDIGADFETSMAQVAATTGMTASDVKGRISDYEDLVSAAKEAGLTTIFSASEAGEALNYLALAGYNVEQSIETMPDILTIAAAGAMDLGRASDMVTDAMNALDLSIEDTDQFIDKMAKTAQSSNTNVEQLGGAILTVGGTATVLAGGVTELDTALGLLANSGIKARQGGTALRQILLNLTAPSNKAAETIEAIGLNVFDLEGNLRPLNEIFKDLNDIMADFTDQQRMETLNAIFDARQIRSANALLQGCGEAWDNLSAKIENSEGAAEKMAETMRSNLNGALNIAKSNLENIAITIYDGISKNLTSLVEEAVPKFQKLNEVLASPEVQSRLQSLSKELKDIGLRVLDIATSEAPKIIDFLSNIGAHLESLRVIITTVIGLNLLTKIPQIIAAIQGLNAVLIANPWLAVIAAVGALTVAIIELHEEAIAQHNAMVAAIQEENDAWDDQRTVIHSIVEEWNDYKESSEKAKAETEQNTQKVRDLYNEYMNLVESGKNANAALDALADVVPEVSTMLENGTVSFNSITDAVNKYCDAIERANQLQQGKADYTQAIETRDALQEQKDAAWDAVTTTQEAYHNAKQAYDDYYNDVYSKTKFWLGPAGTAMFTSQDEELDRLKANMDAAQNLYNENVIAYQEMNTALTEADQMVVDSEKAYLDARTQQLIDEGKIITDTYAHMNTAYQDSLERQNKYWDDAEAIDKKRSQEYADELGAEIDKIEKQILLRTPGYSDQTKIDFYAQWFGTHEDWDRNNEDFLKYFDEWQDLVEKKNKEAIAQSEKAAKERETKAKEQADALKKAIDAGVSDIDYFAGLRGDTADKHSAALKQYVQENMNYYKQNPEEYKKMIQKIANLDKQWLSNTKLTGEERKAYYKSIESFYGEEYKDITDAFTTIVTETEQKSNQEAAEKYFKEWTEGYNDLADKATKAYADIQKSRESFEKNLLGGAELFTQNTEKVFNRFTQQWEEKQGTVINKNAYKDAKKELVDLQTVMGNLKTKGLDEGILNELWGMKPEEALEAAKHLDKLSAGSIQKLNSDYKAFTEEAEKMSQQYYDTQLSEWEEKYWSPLEQYVSEGQADLKKAMALVGEDTVNGFVDGLQSKVDSADEGTKQIMEDVLNTAKETLGIHSPSTVFYEVGENTIQGFLNGIQSKIESIATIFLSLGQRAGDSFVNAFKETWDNFVALMNTTGGLAMPQAMVATTYGTPAFAGGQMVYNGMPTSYTGLTRDDIISAVQEALPDGNVVLSINQKAFAEVSRDALNSLTDNGEMGLKV